MCKTCKLRADLLDKGLSVPIGVSGWLNDATILNYKWEDADVSFKVFFNGKWEDAESIDFDFID
jgi:hypothetical protein